MIKNFFIVSLFLANIMSGAAYIDDSMMRKYSTSYDPTTMWSPKSLGGLQPKTTPEAPSRPRTRIVPISPDTPRKEVEDAVNTRPGVTRFNVDEIIRAEYDAWAFRYGKTKQDDRFHIFRSNFMKQMDFNLKTGKFFLLNEYGDMTSEEYEAKSVDYLENLDDGAVKAVLSQVVDEDNANDDGDLKLNKSSKWSQHLFAMDVEEEIEEAQDAVLEAKVVEDNDEGKVDEVSDAQIFSNQRHSQEDAPMTETHRIFSMGNSVQRAASPEVQSSRHSRTSNSNKKQELRGPNTTRKGGFSVTFSSLFGSVAPMGSSVGSRKTIL
ncbi:hypothetical protein IV203_036741 [Nitzschia inconspicua]|uniref:Cathepsin propeptide inhibitor domain-containing protein n=1 Tax=Nitzschia inconspicua TaxID=303405 RepID=A0A9K3LFT1_9STRA|nr:hypothetical protein IV203_036741 [Nitzschia inconspicua]